MKQKELFGTKGGEKHLYVRRGDNNDVLVTKVEHGQIIDEKDTVHLDTEEARKLGIQLLKLATGMLEGEYDLKTDMETISVCQKINPDDTPCNTACIVINESDETREMWEENGVSPNFDIEGESLEKLISLLAKIV